jgi:hypothetical protein
MPARRASRVFVSYDYDNDLDLKNLLIGQSRHKDTPFFVEDWSVKYASRGWRSDARSRIGRATQVIVICGRYTNQAVGVAAEIEIARDTGTPYYLLRGRKTGAVRRPQGTWLWEKVYPWTWENLRVITTGRV